MATSTMGTRRLFSILLATGSLLHGANLVESGDFPNSAPGTLFVLEAGDNTVSGNISSGGNSPDFVNARVPTGHRLIAASGTINGGSNPLIFFNGNQIYGAVFDPNTNTTTTTSTPLPQTFLAGDYALRASVDFSVGTSWSTTLVVAELPDYEITVSGSSLSITDISGNGDTLTMAAAATNPTELVFSAPGRTFSFDGQANTSGSSENIDLTSISLVTVRTNDGSDTINVGTLPDDFPELSINAGEGDDLLQFSGTINFASNDSLNVNLTNEGFDVADQINVGSGAAITTTGEGNITLRCDQQVRVHNGATLTSANGRIHIEGNAGLTANPGSFTGVLLQGNGTLITSTGTGDIDIKGRGGNAGDFQVGVQMDSGAQIIGGSGRVTVEGTGGSSPNRVNRGITLFSTDTKISSTGGDVVVTGFGGDSGQDFGIGVSLFSDTEISSVAGGMVTVTGIGRGPLGSDANFGIELTGDDARIKTGGGDMLITAIDGIQEERGLVMNGGAFMETPTAAGSIRIETTGLEFDETVIIHTGSPNGSVTVAPANDTDDLFLGNSNIFGRLDLTDAELDRFSTSHLICESESGTIILDGEVSPAQVESFTVSPINGVFTQTPLGGTISLPNGVFAIKGTFQQILDDPLTHQPLVANSRLDLNEASLQSFGFWTPRAGETMTLIESNASEAVAGTFFDLAEGEILFFGSSLSQLAAVSYLGGSGNDVTLTAPNFVQVTNNNDSGPGSLRQALADATSPAYIDFDPNSFTGGGNNTITLTEQLTMPNKTLILDAQSAGGITLDGNQAGRVVNSTSGGTITLDAFSITGGNADQGGGINNLGSGTRMTLLNCSIFGNTVTNAGGGILNFSGGILDATNCTIYNNHADVFGGGIENNSSGSEMTLTNCTIVKNNAVSQNGGLSNNGAFTLIGNTLVAHNTAPALPDIAGPHTSTAPNLIRDNTGSSTEFPIGSPNEDGNYVGDSTTPLEPLLVGDIGDRGPAVINNGGPTPTILPLPGSPAIGNGSYTPDTPALDQRGESRFDNPDIGATQPHWGGLVSVVTPPSNFADLTDPSSSVQPFPSLDSPIGEFASEAIDDTSDKHFSFINVNPGLDITPRLGATSIEAVSFQVSSEPFFNHDPKTFLLLGSNDQWNYTPVLSGEIPDFSTRGSTQFFYRATPSAAYQHYRLVFPSLRFGEDNSQISTEGLAIAEIQLLGTPVSSGLELLDSTTTGTPGDLQTKLTYKIDPQKNYLIHYGPTLEFGNTFSPPANFDSFINVSTIPTMAPTAFFQIEELGPLP
ncbi:right-handed parallel beta-helix repeat-containing protein [Roseibacillus persicicus]|uniref:right-handed parallel beta-helix repeat-containing protein n=1 Tax=Roseibacillus persicicus TaxID=454148 RepID=UPI00167859FC|nr:right-handed parallel beta-helix repeat-containing protein [Roseibacillus persicicus]